MREKDLAEESLVHCWNSIGVWSNTIPSCNKLADVIHCRNCEVYAKAGREIFEKEIPGDYITEWTLEYSEAEQRRQDKLQSIIMFRISNEWFSLPTIHFSEIAHNRPVQRIPHKSGSLILGMTNVRGEIQLCYSLANLLGIEPGDATESSLDTIKAIKRKIVINIEDDVFVFPVDEISGVYRYEESALDDIPVSIMRNVGDLVTGILRLPDKQVACLNPYCVRQLIEDGVGEKQ